MTEHESTPGQWAADRYDWARADTEAMDGDPAFRCIMELRDRVEALEAAQRPTVKDSFSLAGRRPWAAMAYRGVMLLPPIDCIDADLWIADRIYEMGLADGKNATTGNTAPVAQNCAEDAPASSDSLVDRVADAICLAWTGDGFREEARAAILATADWFEQHGWHTSAAIMRQEVGR